jgi:hypothetical protein
MPNKFRGLWVHFVRKLNSGAKSFALKSKNIGYIAMAFHIESGRFGELVEEFLGDLEPSEKSHIGLTSEFSNSRA